MIRRLIYPLAALMLPLTGFALDEPIPSAGAHNVIRGPGIIHQRNIRDSSRDRRMLELEARQKALEEEQRQAKLKQKREREQDRSSSPTGFFDQGFVTGNQ